MKKLVLSFLFFTSIFSVAAQNDSLHFTVGVKESPPFIIKNEDGTYSGISVNLWEKIAKDLDIKYDYKEYKLSDLLLAVENEDVDISINPLTVTSQRASKMRFTQPFFITNLAIATNKKTENKLILFVRNLFSWQFFASVMLLFVVLLAFGFLAWLFERNKNKEEFGPGLAGIGQALWWSAVTMTTVGYGDKAPKTFGGRIVALIWMFTAIIIISGFTASIASSLTVNELESSINGPSDLKKVSVVSVKASSGVDYLKSHNIEHITADNALEGLKSVASNSNYAMVYDEPLMRFVIQNNGMNKKLMIIPNKFHTQYYSFALPKNSEWEELINPILLDKINDQEWNVILNRYGLEE
jgi:polar amino acid transport system substrate-binding protein